MRVLGSVRLDRVARAALFIGPALGIVLVVTLYPLIKSVGISFTDRMFAYGNSSFIGLDNYGRMLTDSLFWHALWNSVKLTALNVAGCLAVGLGLALLLNSRARLTGVFRSLLFLPWAMPSIVIALMFRWLYNDIYGYPNHLLQQLGLIGEPVNLLAGKGTAWAAILLPMIWCFYPFVMLVLLSALQSIDRSLYEAAAIDGAGRWQAFRHVTLPVLKPVLLIVTILEVVWTFSTFDLVYLLTSGGPADSTLTLSMYVYRQGFMTGRLGYAAALGTTMLVVLFGLAAIYFWVIRKSGLYEEEKG